MHLSYRDILTDGQPIRRIRADITTDHPASHYNQPVIVLDDGNALDYQSWILLGYSIDKINKSEQPLMEQWINNMPPVQL